MKKLHRIPALLLLIIISLSSCSDKEDTDQEDDCGAAEHWLSAASIPFTTEQLIISDRYLYYEDTGTPDDICAANTVTATFYVAPKDPGPLADVTSIQGKLYWGLNNEQYVTLTYNSTDGEYRGTVTANLEPFFAEAPGWIGATLIFKMPTHGTLTDDQIYMNTHVDRKALWIDYYHY